MSDTIYTLKDATLSLDGNAGRVDILHGITLELKRGQSLGLIGPSGSGKSSLLMLMGGLERATGGSVSALEHDLTGCCSEFSSGKRNRLQKRKSPPERELRQRNSMLEVSANFSAMISKRTGWQ